MTEIKEQLSALLSKNGSVAKTKQQEALACFQACFQESQSSPQDLADLLSMVHPDFAKEVFQGIQSQLEEKTWLEPFALAHFAIISPKITGNRGNWVGKLTPIWAGLAEAGCTLAFYPSYVLQVVSVLENKKGEISDSVAESLFLALSPQGIQHLLSLPYHQEEKLGSFLKLLGIWEGKPGITPNFGKEWAEKNGYPLVLSKPASSKGKSKQGDALEKITQMLEETQEMIRSKDQKIIQLQEQLLAQMERSQAATQASQEEDIYLVLQEILRLQKKMLGHWEEMSPEKNKATVSSPVLPVAAVSPATPAPSGNTQETSAQLEEYRRTISDLEANLKRAIHVNDSKNNQALVALKLDVVSSLAVVYQNYKDSLDSECDPQLFENYRFSLKKVFKMLERYGMKFEKEEWHGS